MPATKRKVDNSINEHAVKVVLKAIQSKSIEAAIKLLCKEPPGRCEVARYAAAMRLLNNMDLIAVYIATRTKQGCETTALHRLHRRMWAGLSNFRLPGSLTKKMRYREMVKARKEFQDTFNLDINQFWTKLGFDIYKFDTEFIRPEEGKSPYYTTVRQYGKLAAGVILRLLAITPI